MATLKQALTALSVRMAMSQTTKDLGRLAKRLLFNRKDLKGYLARVSAMERFHHDETIRWIKADAIAAGASGKFDACDLLCYLEIAKLAEIAAVPATVILTLTEDEASKASGEINLDNPYSLRIISKLSRALGEAPYSESETPADPTPGDDQNIVEKIYAALDDLPENVMVRHARAGSEQLKLMAGSGLAGIQIEEIAFGPNLAFGPGWVRHGNRRRIDISNHRIVEAMAQGPVGDTQFVARPWVRASRWRIGLDPHRANSPFHGKGRWPCEWRAFIEHGVVVGVSNYYGWLGQATPLDAQKALETRALAQRLADQMIARKLYPTYMDVVFARDNPHQKESVAAFPADDVSCSLDFIETADGLVFLEGGPAHYPTGGGHCCAFAGTRGRPTHGNAMDVSGVAFSLMDGVILADPVTWEAGLTASRAGRILSWAEVEALAASPMAEVAGS